MAPHALPDTRCPPPHSPALASRSLPPAAKPLSRNRHQVLIAPAHLPQHAQSSLRHGETPLRPGAATPCPPSAPPRLLEALPFSPLRLASAHSQFVTLAPSPTPPRQSPSPTYQGISKTRRSPQRGSETAPAAQQSLSSLRPPPPRGRAAPPPHEPNRSHSASQERPRRLPGCREPPSQACRRAPQEPCRSLREAPRRTRWAAPQPLG
mmetsp:Transcript_56237/g.115003  ORF Transcript_56237/g.115003 Transcript_56237/m.115003 type:complete len:208 (-) Transcript_56237:1846-2469(-)